MKTRLLLLFAVLFTGCKDAGTSSGSGQAYQIERTDGFADCEYLAVVDNPENKSTPSNRDVFKIDKDGKMTAMIFYFTSSNDENGNTVKKDTCANIKVVPQRIQSYCKEYTGFYGCFFSGEKGESIFLKNNNFIIRNRDGAIFEGELPIKQSGDVFTMALDKDKNLYYLHRSRQSDDGYIWKFWTDDKKGVNQQIGPEGMKWKHFTLTGQPDVLVAGTITDGVYNSGYPTIIFPNGGFKVLKLESSDSTKQRLIDVGDDVKLITVNNTSYRDDSHEQHYDCKISIESIKTANHTYTKELERSGVGLDYWVAISFSVHCRNHYVFGSPSTLVVCDHNSSEIRFVKPEKFPGEDGDNHDGSIFANRIGNVVFRMNETTNTIDSYDFETLTYKEVPYDDSALGDFHETGRSMTPDPATIIRYGTRSTDGRHVTVETDVRTGKVTIKDLGDSRSFTTLVRLD